MCRTVLCGEHECSSCSCVDYLLVLWLVPAVQRMHVRFTGEPKLAIGVNVGMHVSAYQGCTSPLHLWKPGKAQSHCSCFGLKQYNTIKRNIGIVKRSKRFKFNMCKGLLIQELFVSLQTLFLKLFTIQSRGFIHKVDSISLGILALNEKHFTTVIMQLKMERQL